MQVIRTLGIGTGLCWLSRLDVVRLLNPFKLISRPKHTPDSASKIKPDPTAALIKVCLRNDRSRAVAIMCRYKFSIDVNLFLDTISRSADTVMGKTRNTAIEAVLEEYSWFYCYCCPTLEVRQQEHSRWYSLIISTDAINRAFIRACKSRSILIMPILVVCASKLTPSTIETALILCRVGMTDICVAIIKRWLGYINPSKDVWDHLTATSIAIGFSLDSYCSHYDSQAIHMMLNSHYRHLPGADAYDRKHWPRSLMRCATHGNINMVEALLTDDPKHASRFLIEGAESNRPRVVKLIAERFRYSIKLVDIETAMNTAIYYEHVCVIDMLMDLFRCELTPAFYIRIFNGFCEREVRKAVDLMLIQCESVLLLDRSPESYPYKVMWLRKQFPDWTYEA